MIYPLTPVCTRGSGCKVGGVLNEIVCLVVCIGWPDIKCN